MKKRKLRLFPLWGGLLLIGMLTSALLVFPAGAEGSRHWYCRHVKGHEKPAADPSFSDVGELGGVYIAPGEEKVLYLTFDAGYENGNVARILDVLKKEEVPAAFFVLSHLVEKDTELVKRMQAEGHLVCNHTAHHRDMSRVSDRETFAAELQALEDVYTAKTGEKLAPFYRPPEGSFTAENLQWAKEMGYTTVFWSFAYADWDNGRQPDPEAAKEKILSNLHPGEIMLLHPTSAANAAILEEVIAQCRKEGYRFGSLAELVSVG